MSMLSIILRLRSLGVQPDARFAAAAKKVR